LIRLDLAINGSEVKVQLTDVFRSEFGGFEFDHDVAMQLNVVKEKVDKEIGTIDFEMDLTAQVGKPGAELDKEIRDVVHKRLLDRTLLGFAAQFKEVELIWILQRVAGEIRIGAGDSPCEVRDGLAAVVWRRRSDWSPSSGPAWSISASAESPTQFTFSCSNQATV